MNKDCEQYIVKNRPFGSRVSPLGIGRRTMQALVAQWDRLAAISTVSDPLVLATKHSLIGR
jgi:hypothetical protein